MFPGTSRSYGDHRGRTILRHVATGRLRVLVPVIDTDDGSRDLVRPVEDTATRERGERCQGYSLGRARGIGPIDWGGGFLHSGV